MVMHMDQSCCGLNLKTGSLIIGVFFAVETFCSLVTYSSKADSVYEDYTSASDAKEIKGVFVYLAVLNSAMLVTNILLIMGATQERASYLFPWVIAYTVLAAIKALGYLILAIVCFMLSTSAVATGVAVLITGCISVCLYTYCILIVFSYYRTLTGTVPLGV
ncbi:uncharacterized protein [Anabrus simplex]|uniref:uncharacterized protein n=1 Tax=Anabrus simplex TaxID=316456 RepID=UPI0035A2C42A